MHAGRIVLPFQRFGWSKKGHAIAAADFGLWSGISAHRKRKVKRSNASLLGGAATIMWNRRHIANDGEVKADSL